MAPIRLRLGIAPQPLITTSEHEQRSLSIHTPDEKLMSMFSQGSAHAGELLHVLRRGIHSF